MEIASGVLLRSVMLAVQAYRCIRPPSSGSMNNFWDSFSPSTFVNEADVEHQLILPLLYALGYETKEIAPKYPVEFREGGGDSAESRRP